LTFGLKSTKPETGFGNIGADLKRFRQKPNKETAETFIKNGSFYWNSGMLFKYKIINAS
jgi:mannose-1-phosphate guanylyltransferase